MPRGERAPEAEATRRRPRGRLAPAELLERPTRSQQAERIEALAGRGLDSEEIAARLGLARSTVNKCGIARARAVVATLDIAGGQIML